MTIWVIRILFLFLCTIAGYAVSQLHPMFVGASMAGMWGCMIGFGFGWVMIAIDEMITISAVLLIANGVPSNKMSFHRKISSMGGNVKAPSRGTDGSPSYCRPGFRPG